MDSPVSFINKVSVQDKDLPGWNSNPARLGNSSFGFSYWNAPEVADTKTFSLAGEWGKNYRIAFFDYYSEMDSLFREVYGEWNVSYNVSLFCLGIGYGTLLGWVPNESKWLRHRLKFGTGILWNHFYGNLWTDGFTDDSWNLWGGIFWQPSKVLFVSITSNGKSLNVSHGFKFKYGSLVNNYGFPHFSMGIELVFSLKKWNFGGTHGFGNGNLDYNGVWIQKKFYFQ